MIINDTASLLTMILPNFEFIEKTDFENVNFNDVDKNFNAYKYDLVSKEEYNNVELKQGIKAKLNNGYFVLEKERGI